MLYEFVDANRDTIMARTVEKLSKRSWPPAAMNKLEHGVPVFLTQLSETLRWEATATPFPPTAIGFTAARNGRDLLALGFTVSQVVHNYGDICQAITELALEQSAPIDIEEFHILNRCLDTAIAEAVTEYARLSAERRGPENTDRFGQVARELRNVLNTALIAFQTVKQGAVSINGSTGMVLGRALIGLRDLIEGALSEVRVGAGALRRERLTVAEFLDEVAVVANLHAEYRQIRLSIEPTDRQLAIDADPELLSSAVMNLLSNAFKFTPVGGRVVLRAHNRGDRVLIEVADECGGIRGPGDPFQASGEGPATDRVGLGLGLSIARKAVQAQGGDIHLHNLPGKGCVFVIDVPGTREEEISGSHASMTGTCAADSDTMSISGGKSEKHFSHASVVER